MIEINWLQDIDINIIQCNALSPYISDKDCLMNNCHLLLYLYYYLKIISDDASFITNLLLQNNIISVSIVKNYI